MNRSFNRKGIVQTDDVLGELLAQISTIIDTTPWNDFKDQRDLIPTIEIKALLLKAQEKVKKILIS